MAETLVLYKQMLVRYNIANIAISKVWCIRYYKISISALIKKNLCKDFPVFTTFYTVLQIHLDHSDIITSNEKSLNCRSFIRITCFNSSCLYIIDVDKCFYFFVIFHFINSIIYKMCYITYGKTSIIKNSCNRLLKYLSNIWYRSYYIYLLQ